MRATQHWAVPPASTADTAQNTSNTPVLAAVFADDKLIVAAGTTPLVYAVDTGELLATLSGHKDTVNCVCSMLGGGFASGGKDCLVILWNASLQGILKYSHSDQIQALAQNQTGTLLSCTMSDFGLWSPNVKAVQKTRVNAKIVSCAWTDDGLYFALGMYNGAVSIRTVSGIEHASIQRNAPVWALAWTPSTESAQMLAVTDWDQTFQLYAVSGQPVGKQRRLGYDPCTIQPFKEYFLMGGSNRHLHLWTAQGTCISQLCDRPGWVWACAGHPIKNLIAVASQDGSVTMFQFEMMHEYSLYKETYAFRHSLTDVRIQNLTNDQTTVIKCRDFIKNISIYKDRLAVCLPERTVIYDLFHDDENNMHFRIKDKLIGLPECTFMHVFANNLVQTHEKSVCLYNMLGEKEREWILDSPLTTTRVLGGPRGRESFLVALQNGDIYKIFVDSAFPVPILSHPTLVSQVDINLLRTKLAIVDDKHVCSVYDIATKELLYQEHDVDSVAWNSLIDDMLCFSGKDSYTVKSGRYTTPSQSTTGRIAGFKASQVYILNKHGMAVSDISPTPLVTRYAQDGDFDTAYRIASIGMSQSDWSRLAKSAFEHLRFEIARKCYARTNDFKMLENIRHLEKLKVQYTSEPDMLMAHVYMLTAKYQEVNLCDVGSEIDEEVWRGAEGC